MSTKFSTKTLQSISEIGAPVSSEELDAYKFITEVDDKSLKINTILSTWSNQQNEERKIRKVFALALLICLFFQIIIINTTFFLIGFNVLIISQWLANTFILAVFAEIVSMSYIVLKYLFPRSSNELVSLIAKL